MQEFDTSVSGKEKLNYYVHALLRVKCRKYRMKSELTSLGRDRADETTEAAWRAMFEIFLKRRGTTKIVLVLLIFIELNTTQLL